jgi:diguanylate cyclase
VSERPDGKGDAEVKARDLAQLQEQTQTARRELHGVQHELLEAEDRLAHTQLARLVEVNEQLVVSNLRAHAEVETCAEALAAASRFSELDPLTGLASRALLFDRLEQSIAGARRHRHLFALLFLDLDGFKQINDTLGHAAGDEALQEAARCLRASVRETDTVCRYGGDEFVILLAEVSDGNDAGRVAEKVRAALAAARPVDAGRRLTASVGISLYPQDGDDARALIDRADAAMYRAKERGPGSTVLCGQEDDGGSSPPLP